MLNLQSYIENNGDSELLSKFTIRNVFYCSVMQLYIKSRFIGYESQGPVEKLSLGVAKKRLYSVKIK